MGNCCSPGCRLWCLRWCLFVLFFFPRGVLDEILNLIESVSEGFPSYFFMYPKFCVIFFQFHPTHSRSVYDPTGIILAILYSKVPHMLHAKYQPNWHSGSGEEVV